MSDIKNLNKELKKKVPSLNWGGCGLFAFMAAQALLKRGYKPVIVVLEDTLTLSGPFNTTIEQRKQNIEELILSKSRNSYLDVNFHHCAVEVIYKGHQVVFDGHTDDISMKYVMEGTYTLKQLRTAVIQKYAWNGDFNRKTNARLIQNALNKHLK